MKSFFSQQQATSGPFKGLGDLLRRYPESQFTDREKGFEQMFTGEYAYMGVIVCIIDL